MFKFLESTVCSKINYLKMVLLKYITEHNFRCLFYWHHQKYYHYIHYYGEIFMTSNICFKGNVESLKISCSIDRSNTFKYCCWFLIKIVFYIFCYWFLIMITLIMLKKLIQFPILHSDALKLCYIGVICQ